MLVKDLPQDIREVAFERYLEEQTGGTEEHFLRISLGGAFGWSETIEGLGVWSEVDIGKYENFYKLYPPSRFIVGKKYKTSGIPIIYAGVHAKQKNLLLFEIAHEEDNKHGSVLLPDSIPQDYNFLGVGKFWLLSGEEDIKEYKEGKTFLNKPIPTDKDIVILELIKDYPSTILNADSLPEGFKKGCRVWTSVEEWECNYPVFTPDEFESYANVGKDYFKEVERFTVTVEECPNESGAILNKPDVYVLADGKNNPMVFQKPGGSISLEHTKQAYTGIIERMEISEILNKYALTKEELDPAKIPQPLCKMDELITAPPNIISINEESMWRPSVPQNLIEPIPEIKTKLTPRKTQIHLSKKKN